MPTDNPYARNQLYLIPVSELQPDPDQPRKFIDPAALQELTASVGQVGVLQPILFRVENGVKYIVAGERRFAAAQAAGLTEIPFNRHFYEYEPPRPLAEIEEDINGLEKEILAMLSEVTT